MHIPVPSAPSQLSGATLGVCRNLECYTATLPALPAANTGGVAVYFPSDSPVLATLSQQVDQTVVLDVEWHVADVSQTVDGDHYVVTMTSGTGSPSALLDKTAAYHPTQPSPEECTPAASCSIAELAP
jgi:hypothetical protein